MCRTWTVKRVFNNNAAMVSDSGGDLVVIGRGICFGKKVGDPIPQSKAERVFAPTSPEQYSRLETLLSSIDSSYITLAGEIVDALTVKSSVDLDDRLILSLADHISLSLEREANGEVLPNPMLIDIEATYPEAYSLAGTAACVIRKRTGITVSDEERGFIALHIANASSGQTAERVMESLRLVRGITRVIRDTSGRKLDTSSFAYRRFIRHLRLLSLRILNRSSDDTDAPSKGLIEREAHRAAFQCLDAIESWLAQERGYRLTAAEREYLSYHLAVLMG